MFEGGGIGMAAQPISRFVEVNLVVGALESPQCAETRAPTADYRYSLPSHDGE